MDRKLWTNGARRPTLMGESIRSGYPRSKNKNLRKLRDFSGNKENENGGTKRITLGARALNFKSESQEVSSRRSITRRLSFLKTEMESADGSPIPYAGSQHENFQGFDEPAYTSNPTLAVSSPLPFRNDVLKKEEQKQGFTPTGIQFNLSNYEYEKNGGVEKLGLSEETKRLIIDMGIEISPDHDSVKKNNFKGIPEKKGEKIGEQFHTCKEVQTDTEHKINGASGKFSVLSDFQPKTSIEKDFCRLETTPQLCTAEVAETSSEGSDNLSDVLLYHNLYLRHVQEREELNKKQQKEVEEFMSNIKETNKGKLNNQNKNFVCEGISCISTPRPRILISFSDNSSAVPILKTEVAVMSQIPESATDASLQVTAITSEARNPVNNTVSPRKLATTLPLQNCILSAEVADCQNINSGTDDRLDQLENVFGPQTWRTHEVSLIETPRAGKWLVTENENEDISASNTSTLDLNSMLQGMSIQGQQPCLETPATRRLITRRILQEMESLFN